MQKQWIDQFYDRQYRQDEAFGVLMGGFTGLALPLGVLAMGMMYRSGMSKMGD